MAQRSKKKALTTRNAKKHSAGVSAGAAAEAVDVGVIAQPETLAEHEPYVGEGDDEVDRSIDLVFGEGKSHYVEGTPDNTDTPGYRGQAPAPVLAVSSRKRIPLRDPIVASV